MDSAAQDLDLARQGDGEALARLLEGETPGLRATVLAALPKRWSALLAPEDVLQQTFTDAFTGIGRFVPVGEGAFGAWLRTLARNNVRDAVRALEADKRGGGARPMGAQEAEASAASLLEDLWRGSQTSPSGHLARKEEVRALLQAVEQLPSTYARVVQGLDFEGHTAAELAEEFGRSPGAVHLLRHRALRRLRAVLDGSTEI